MLQEKKSLISAPEHRFHGRLREVRATKRNASARIETIPRTCSEKACVRRNHTDPAKTPPRPSPHRHPFLHQHHPAVAFAFTHDASKTHRRRLQKRPESDHLRTRPAVPVCSDNTGPRRIAKPTRHQPTRSNRTATFPHRSRRHPVHPLTDPEIERPQQFHPGSLDSFCLLRPRQPDRLFPRRIPKTPAIDSQPRFGGVTDCETAAGSKHSFESTRRNCRRIYAGPPPA